MQSRNINLVKDKGKVTRPAESVFNGKSEIDFPEII